MVALWLLLSGLFKVQLIVLGALSVVLVVWLSNRMRVLEHRGQPIYFRVLHILGYWGWLLREIFLSNVDVARRVLRPGPMDIAPMLRRVAATPDTELGRVVYANSITLTPGTTAINFTPEGDILVHALHVDSLTELEKGEMADHVRDVEPHFPERSNWSLAGRETEPSVEGAAAGGEPDRRRGAADRRRGAAANEGRGR